MARRVAAALGLDISVDAGGSSGDSEDASSIVTTLRRLVSKGAVAGLAICVLPAAGEDAVGTGKGRSGRPKAK